MQNYWKAVGCFTKNLYVSEKHTKILSTELKIFQVFWKIFRFLKEIRRFFGNFEDFLDILSKTYTILKSNKQHWWKLQADGQWRVMAD